MEKHQVLTVLVADDEPELLGAVCQLIDWESLGFRLVGRAGNGLDALQLVEALQPDFLLTDIRMPFISGTALTRQAKAVQPLLQVAFLSGYDDFEYAKAGIEDEIVAYLLKPISMAELTEELRKIHDKIEKRLASLTRPQGGAEALRMVTATMLLDEYARPEPPAAAESLRSAGMEIRGDEHIVVAAFSLPDGAHPELLPMAERIFSRAFSCCGFSSGDRAVLLLASGNGFGRLYASLDELRQATRRALGAEALGGLKQGVRLSRRWTHRLLRSHGSPENRPQRRRTVRRRGLGRHGHALRPGAEDHREGIHGRGAVAAIRQRAAAHQRELLRCEHQEILRRHLHEPADPKTDGCGAEAAVERQQPHCRGVPPLRLRRPELFRLLLQKILRKIPGADASGAERGQRMKKKGLSMNLIMALTLTAVAVSVLLCVNLVFMQTYRQTLLRNAETTSRQAIAQAGSTMNEYLEDMNDAVTLLTGYLELPAEEREARFEAFLEIRADVVAVTTYDAEGEMRNCYSLGRRLREDILQNLSFDPDKRELYETGFISAPHVMSIFVEDYPWVVTIIRPSLTREGERYIAVDVSCSNISTYISGVGIGQRGYCFLEDTEGNLVYHPQQQLIYSELKSENTDLTASLPDGTHVEGSTIYTVQTLENGIWRVVGVSSFQELITDALREIMRITFIGALFILAAAVLLSLLLSRVLSSPIHDLIVAMQSFEKTGEGFSYEPVTGVREVENLSASFDHMVKKIQKLMATVRSEEVNLRKTELKALQAQINPHFLYNTLDSISWMCEQGKNAEAVVMVNALARLFRISISKGHELIPIRSEVQHAQSYLQIQSVRYKEQFSYHFDVEEDCTEYLCNKITLQPIIENAIYHGVNGLVDEGHIEIRVRAEGEDVLFTVEDNGVGMEPEQIEEIFRRKPDGKSGIGIKNVNDRLKIWFGDAYGITIESVPDEGTKVTVRMPKVREEVEHEKH